MEEYKKLEKYKELEKIILFCKFTIAAISDTNQIKIMENHIKEIEEKQAELIIKLLQDSLIKWSNEIKNMKVYKIKVFK